MNFQFEWEEEICFGWPNELNEFESIGNRMTDLFLLVDRKDRWKDHFDDQRWRSKTIDRRDGRRETFDDPNMKIENLRLNVENATNKCPHAKSDWIRQLKMQNEFHRDFHLLKKKRNHLDERRRRRKRTICWSNESDIFFKRMTKLFSFPNSFLRCSRWINV